jgi:hypothetical protein
MTIDLTFLRRKNLIELKKLKHKEAESHYPVTVLLECQVIDRDIKLIVRWPPRAHEKPIMEHHLSLVAAFLPGTK